MKKALFLLLILFLAVLSYMGYHYYTVTYRQSRMEAFISSFIQNPLPNRSIGVDGGIIIRDSLMQARLSSPNWYNPHAQYKEFFRRDGYRIHLHYTTTDSNGMHHDHYTINNDNMRVMLFDFQGQDDEVELKNIDVYDCFWEYTPPK